MMMASAPRLVSHYIGESENENRYRRFPLLSMPKVTTKADGSQEALLMRVQIIAYGPAPEVLAMFDSANDDVVRQ
jgi:hypothetical protein